MHDDDLDDEGDLNQLTSRDGGLVLGAHEVLTATADGWVVVNRWTNESRAAWAVEGGG